MDLPYAGELWDLDHILLCNPLLSVPVIMKWLSHLRRNGQMKYVYDESFAGPDLYIMEKVWMYLCRNIFFPIEELPYKYRSRHPLVTYETAIGEYMSDMYVLQHAVNLLPHQAAHIIRMQCREIEVIDEPDWEYDYRYYMFWARYLENQTVPPRMLLEWRSPHKGLAIPIHPNMRWSLSTHRLLTIEDVVDYPDAPWDDSALTGLASEGQGGFTEEKLQKMGRWIKGCYYQTHYPTKTSANWIRFRRRVIPILDHWRWWVKHQAAVRIQREWRHNINRPDHPRFERIYKAKLEGSGVCFRET